LPGKKIKTGKIHLYEFAAETALRREYCRRNFTFTGRLLMK